MLRREERREMAGGEDGDRGAGMTSGRGIKGQGWLVERGY